MTKGGLLPHVALQVASSFAQIVGTIHLLARAPYDLGKSVFVQRCPWSPENPTGVLGQARPGLDA